MSAWPARLLAARDALDPLIRAAGYRFVGLEAIGTTGRSGSAEYRTEARRIRIVCEGDEGAIWVDTAAERDAQIVSPWVDLEWSLTGRRDPPPTGLHDDRIAELIEIVTDYLSRAGAPKAS